MTKPSKKYSLVLFLEDDCDKKSVDVVPTDWLFCDKRGSIYCPFIDDFTSSNISLLEKLVRDRKPPNDAWKTYRVDVRGHADTYKEAIKHLEKLKTEPYAFSTDNEDRIKEKQDKIRKQCRLKGVQNKQVDALTSSTAALDKPLEFKKKLDMLHGQPNTSDEDSSVSNSFDEINSVSSDLEPAVQKKISVLEDGNNVTFDMNKMLTFISKSFEKLTYQVGTIQSEILIIKQELQRLKELPSFRPERSEKQHKLNLPFKTLEDFHRFDEQLKNEQTLQNEMFDTIWVLINPEEKITKSLNAIIAKFLARDVIMNFTTLKKIGDKLIFKDTAFCSCIYETMVAVFKKSSKIELFKDKLFYDGIGTVFNNAKDWEGYRKKRNKSVHNVDHDSK